MPKDKLEYPDAPWESSPAKFRTPLTNLDAQELEVAVWRAMVEEMGKYRETAAAKHGVAARDLITLSLKLQAREPFKCTD